MGKPLRFKSAYRSQHLNMAIGGDENSQHTKGEAVDILVDPPSDGWKMMRYIIEHLKFDQLILERDSVDPIWLHVSLKRKGKNRRQIMFKVH
jgi:hypothetical protein